jgi:glycosyltransferase involved in cell wall biosynthesis
MKLSIIVPAYNEAGYIEYCLASIHAALEANSELLPAAEVIVVDNNSSDATAALAEAAGARVVREPVNQISRARNAGAAAACGDWLMFIDADSQLSTDLLGAALLQMQTPDFAGCGCLMDMGRVPFPARLMLGLWSTVSVALNWAAGSFIVCRADIFRALGGFSEELFAAEEIDFSRRMKRLARSRNLRFLILRDYPLRTSARKLRLYSTTELAGQTFRLFLRPRRSLRSRGGLGVWYDGRR